jgi:methyltransferase family protein
MRLEIGGGHLVPAGTTNLDPTNGQPPWKIRAQDVPWPTSDGSVESIRASHVLEHIPTGQDRILVFNEAHRVLVPGGTFEVIVPLVMAYGQWVGTWHAWADPTHCSYWCLPESFHYLDGTFAANADYGIRLWETLSMEVRSGWEGFWVGRPR